MNQRQTKLLFSVLAAALLLALTLCSWLAAFNPGITWDEPAYVASGYQYVQWLTQLSPNAFGYQQIDETWRLNHEHPPLAKIIYGFAALLEGGDTMASLMAARLAAALIFVALVAAVLFFTTAHYGKVAGMLAALSLVLMPRVFGHGHLAALDMPVALLVFATTAIFARFDEKPVNAAAWAGVVWGLALLTKLNAVFVILVIIPWALWRKGREAVLPCVVFLAIGTAVFFAAWPWLWHDTVDRVAAYVINKTERINAVDRPTGTTDVPVHYLGVSYKQNDAPWHYPFVMILATMPLAIIIMSQLGSVKARKEKQHVTLLVVASVAVHLGIFALPGVPKYDGVRLMMPVFPFIACLAGIGGAWFWQRYGVGGKIALLTVLALDLGLLIHAHPYELSYYNLAVGGAWGAQKLGFETTYWGDTLTQTTIDEIVQLTSDSTITVRPRYLDFLPWSDVEVCPSPTAQYIVVFPRQGYLDDETRRLLEAQVPLRQWKYFGVSQCLLYHRHAGSADFSDIDAVAAPEASGALPAATPQAHRRP